MNKIPILRESAEYAYPFIPLIDIPSIKYFCPIKNIITIGTRTTVAAAIIYCHCAEYIPWNCISPSDNVNLSPSFKYTRGPKKSFHDPMKENNDTTINDGLLKGIIIFEYIV